MLHEICQHPHYKTCHRQQKILLLKEKAQLAKGQQAQEKQLGQNLPVQKRQAQIQPGQIQKDALKRLLSKLFYRCALPINRLQAIYQRQPLMCQQYGS